MKDNVELIHLAIQQLIEEKRGERSKTSGDSFIADDEDQLLLSRLLSQLELIKEDDTSKLPEPQAETKEPPSSEVVKVETKDETGGGHGGGSTEMGTEEIVKELRKVKRQNSITHRLLSFLIVLTVAWQLSEVSLILTLKNKLSNPFRSIGSMITGVLRGGSMNHLKGGDTNEPDAAKHSSSTNLPQIEPPSLPLLKIPKLPNMDLPVLGLNGGDD